VATEPVGDLVKAVGHDLPEAVVGLDVAELLVGGALAVGGRGGLSGGALGAFANDPGLVAQLAIEVGQALLDVGAARWRRRRARLRRMAPALAGDRRVGILDLLEAPGGLGRAVVVVGVVELDQPTVSRPQLLVGYAGPDAENRVGVGAAQGLLTASLKMRRGLDLAG
jgi:hypothetical protein